MARLNRGAAIFTVLVTMVGGFEGLRTYAYKDPVGIPTICFGETQGVRMGQTKTVDECKEMLGTRLIEFSQGIDRCLTNEAAIPDETYGAMVSLSYNIGVGAFCNSTLVKKANRGDLVGACNEFPKWRFARGIPLPGLATRRAEEKQMCLNGLS